MKNLNLKSVALASALAVGAMSANAAGVDVTSVVTTITDQLGPIGLIGGAILGVVVAVAAFKWLRRGIS